MSEDTVEPKPKDGISRRDFLKITALVTVKASGADQLLHLQRQQGVEVPTAEHVGVEEGLLRPTKLIDQLMDKISERGLEDGKYWRPFLDMFSEIHSSDPDEARKNRNALDYAFGERGLGKRIIDAVTEELSVDTPGVSLDKLVSMGRVRAGDNQTLNSVVFLFSSAVTHSSADLSSDDGERLLSGMKDVLQWVEPMVEDDYVKEKHIYADRARKLNNANELFRNTIDAWSNGFEESQGVMLQILRAQDKYFPSASAGLGSINPGDSSYHDSNGLVEEIYVYSEALDNWVNYEDLNGLEYFVVSLLHEQMHQFQRDTMDFDLLQVLHPEDVLEDQELRNAILKEFREKVAGMTSSDINAFIDDPGIAIKFASVQNLSQERNMRAMISELQLAGRVLQSIDNGDTEVRRVGMEEFFAPEDTANPGQGRFRYGNNQDNIQRLRNLSLPLSDEQQVMQEYSRLMFATYALLVKLDKAGLLREKSELNRVYPEIRKIVEGQVMHATMGPPGEYLHPRTSGINLRDNPFLAMEKLKEEAAEARKGCPATEGSVDLVNFLYDQTPLRMEVMARVMGGNGVLDYTRFFNEILQLPKG